MRFQKVHIIAVLSTLFSLSISYAQVLRDSSGEQGLLISYQLEIKPGIKKTSIAETYNGGSKTIFVSGNKARIRLVALMRIESIFFDVDESNISKISIIKESGRKPQKKELTTEEWKLLNNKYDSAGCELLTGEKTILGYACKKAVIHLPDGRSISTYYSPVIPPLPALYEPAFACLPGAVLEYTYQYKNGSATYTAVSVRKEEINPAIFQKHQQLPSTISTR